LVVLSILLTEEFVTIFAMIYALDYLKNDNHNHVFYALLLVFSAGMSGTTMANDIFLFYFFWELMLIASTLLLVNWGETEKRTAIALKYFIITHLGSLLVLIAFILIYAQSGVDNFSSLQAAVQMMPERLPLIGALFLLGFGVKMALVPFHIWLPDTHSEAPMPVTIMLAAAMLSMGTYGILRFPMSFLTMQQMAIFSLPMMIGGVVSELYGAIIALVETDIKRIIAYSSVSQMGYILFGLGTLTFSGVVGATLHVIYHAIVKALLFCCVGWIIKATGKRDIQTIGGLGKTMPFLSVCMMLVRLPLLGSQPWRSSTVNGSSLVAVFNTLSLSCYPRSAWFVTDGSLYSAFCREMFFCAGEEFHAEASPPLHENCNCLALGINCRYRSFSRTTF
jgi:NADH-quinone oxidoreductase subunit M